MNDLTNLELLRLATELAYSDYNNRRANLHNQWLVDNDKMKRMYGTSVPYPAIPPYPTEEEIVAKAKKLIEFLSVPRPDIEKNETQVAFKQLITEVEEYKKEEVNPTPNIIIEESSINKKEEVKKDRDIVIEEKPTPNNIPVEKINTEKTSVIDKIKKVWR
jgi:hypothetical protein